MGDKVSDPRSVVRDREYERTQKWADDHNWRPPKLGDIQAGFDKAAAATPRKREKLYTYKSKGSTRYTNEPGARRGER